MSDAGLKPYSGQEDVNMIHPDTFRRLSGHYRNDMLREAARDRLIYLLRQTAPRPREPWRKHVALGLAGALVSAGTRLQHHYRPAANDCATC